MKKALDITLFSSCATIISIKKDRTVNADGFNSALTSKNTKIKESCIAFTKKNKRYFVPADAAAGTETFFVISQEGDVLQFGQNEDISEYGEIKADNWKDITDIVAVSHAVGLKKDGTVVASGYNKYGQCEVSKWSNIKKIACSLFSTAAIKEDGSVVFCGSNTGWTGNLSSWKNIKDIFCTEDYLLGIDNDGNVYYYGEDSENSKKICEWKNVDKIIGISDYFAALTKDGSVLVSGYEELEEDAKGWTDIKDILFADYLLVALDKNGKTFVAGNSVPSRYSAFDNKVWKNWTDIIKIVAFNEGFLGLEKSGKIKACLPDAWEYRAEQLPKAKKWTCFSSLDSIDEDYEKGCEEFKKMLEEEMNKPEEEPQKAPEKKKAPLSPNASWLEKTIYGAETDEARLTAMAKIRNKIKKEEIGVHISSFVFKLLFFINSFTASWGTFYLFSSKKERKTFLKAMPDVLAALLKGFKNFYYLFLTPIRDFIKGLDLEIKSDGIKAISAIIVAIILVVIIPSLVSRLIRLIFRLIPDKTSANISSTDVKSYAEETYDRLCNRTKHRKNLYITLPACVLLSIITAAIITAVLIIFDEEAVSEGVNSTIVFGCLFTLIGSYLAYQIIALLPRAITKAGLEKYFTFKYDDSRTFISFWGSFDPDRNKINKKAVEEESEFMKSLRREYKHTKPRGSSSYSSSGRARITLDARGASSANQFTIYVDDRKECSFWGGTTRTISVSSGRHKIQAQIYNDSAEYAYTLDPIINTFSAGEDATIEYN